MANTAAKRTVFLLTLAGALRAAEECRIQLPAFHYPPLAMHARVQGMVQLRVSIASEQLSAKPSVTGHPLLAAAAEQAIEGAQWAGCQDGEQNIVFEFRLTDPCLPRPLSIDQTGPARFQVAISQPNPCVFAMKEYVVRRFLFWKKRLVRCEEVCPPCRPGAP